MVKEKESEADRLSRLEKSANEVRSDGFDKNAVPPDNGPWYISFCNWLGTMYERFDGTFVNFFIF